jgi:Tn3 transposase DDE domain
MPPRRRLRQQLHALARDVFYGRRGRINARELWEQMNTCSCLTLILACIVYWQAREISRVLSQCDPVGNGIDLSLLEHVSPSSGTTSCFMANTSWIGSSSADVAGP